MASVDLVSLKLRLEELIQEQTTGSAQSSDVIDSTIQEQALEAALLHYHRNFARFVYDIVTGNASSWYKLTGTNPELNDYKRHTSEICEVRYPYDNTKADADRFIGEDLLSRRSWRVVQHVSVITGTPTAELYLELIGYEPAATEKIAVLYTTPHTIDGLDSETVTTIPTEHERAFSYLAAHYATHSLVGLEAHRSRGSAGAEIAISEKSDLWKRVSEYFLKKYMTLSGLDESGEIAFVTMIPERYGS